jgi:hypothetical protein
VGAGWYEKDYTVYGYDYGTVKSRMDLFAEGLERIIERAISWPGDATSADSYANQGVTLFTTEIHPTDQEAYAKPVRELPAVRRMYHYQPGFRVNFFFREDFVYLYDELSSPGKMSSRS